MQVADQKTISGMMRPALGEIRFDLLFAQLERLGYNGWIGCEYKPAGRTEDGLGWLPAGALKPRR